MSALTIDSGAFNYVVKYSSKRRSLALMIKQGELTVRAPSGVSLADINILVAQKQNWILKHLSQTRVQVAPDWLAERKIPLSGNMLELSVLRAAKNTISLEDNKVCVAISTRTKEDRVRERALALLQQWYKQQAERLFNERVGYWQRQMGLQASNVIIGNWKTKWGYCKQTAELGFNWRLMMAPVWVADYVVVHELAHLVHLNHSVRFWQLVNQFYANADEAKAWLKLNQHRMEL